LQNGKLVASIFNKVDGKAYEKAFQAEFRCKKISIAKLSHKLLNTNYQNSKYYCQPSTCPCCNHYEESYNHMLSCPLETTTAYRLNQIEKLEEHLNRQGTPPSITKALLRGITRWTERQMDPSSPQRSSTVGSLKPLDIAITQAYTEQTQTLGWDNLHTSYTNNFKK
jgi:hypothetical protein